MARISKDYASHSKDDLQAEADVRGLTVVGTGTNGAILKDDLVVALEDNDTAPEQPKTPLPKLTASPIPQVQDGTENTPFVPGDAPKDEDYTDGVFTRTSDGEDYALAIHEPDTYGKTHSAKNSRHFWQGTKEEFKKEFEKK